jgi:hypothetical protein
MRLNTFLLIASLLAIFFALGFLVAPAQVLSQYGVQSDADDALMSRFFGAALLHLGLVLYFIRDVTDPYTQKGLVHAGVIGSACGLLVALSGRLNGVVNALGWSTVLIYALLLAGYVSFLRNRR